VFVLLFLVFFFVAENKGLRAKCAAILLMKIAFYENYYVDLTF